jgi:iron complex transport system substrate-binding protein
MKNRRAFGLVAALIMGLAAPAVASDVVAVVDSTGRSVEVPQPVERIASVYGIGTYYVYALGAGDRLVAAWYVGVKTLGQAPASLREIEPRLDALFSVGDPNVEELAARGTDLVLADAAKHEAFAEQMQGIGVPTLLLAPETTQGVVDTTLALGAALGEAAADRAARWVSDFWRVFAASETAVRDIPSGERPRVLFVGSSSLHVASGAMYQTQLIEAAGGVSVSAGLVGGWNTVNLEQVLVWNPDIVIIPPYGNVTVADLLTNADWQSVRAVQTGRVARMPRIFAPMDTPLPESLLGVMWLSSVLYPERETFAMRTEAAAFYETYYGYTLSQAEADSFLTP